MGRHQSATSGAPHNDYSSGTSACGFASVPCSARILSCSAASTSQPSAPSVDISCDDRRQPVFTLAQGGARRRGKPSLGTLILKRPIAAVALVPEPAILFTAGAVAGAFGTFLAGK